MIKDIEDKFKNFVPYINGFQNMKRASVLIPLVEKDDSCEILFEVRAKTLRRQPNEISFPGGKIEKGEKPVDACIRETCEELGTIPENIEIISPLDLYVNHSNLIIHPYVGIIKDAEHLSINADEVDHTFTAPVDYLIDYSPEEFENEIKIDPSDDFPYDRIPNKKNYKFAVGKYPVLFYEYKDYIIWGITARILENFLTLIKK